MLSFGVAASAALSSTSYWIWAGVPIVESIPRDATLYLYQGAVRPRRHEDTYARKGLYPHPLPHSEIFIVLRLENGLPTPEKFITLAQSITKQWEAHHLRVKGLQIDFDSPTGKLLEYKDFLAQVRSLWPSQYQLSITALGDWLIAGDRKTLKEITNLTDEIIFQLYTGRRTLPDAPLYVDNLVKANFPFKIGLLTHKASAPLLARAKNATNFRGVLYFLQG